jgi:hypothetical protein
MAHPFLPGAIGFGCEPWRGPEPLGAPAPPAVPGWLPGLQSPEVAEGVRRFSEDYLSRLRRADWAGEIRPRIIARAAGVCERCGARTHAFEVHHLDYSRLGHEDDSDLQALCPACHPEADSERREAACAAALERAEEALENARFRGWCEAVYGGGEPPPDAWERFEVLQEMKDFEEAHS